MFDLIVLGGGPAGYMAAEHAARARLSVCLFEQRALGGVCLNEGCIPSKALLHSVKLYEYVSGGAVYSGVSCQNPVFDYKAAVLHKDKVVETLVGGIEATLKSLSITVKREHAVIEGRDNGGFRVGGQTGKNLLIATGSEPILPAIKGIETCLTNREILALTCVPKSLAIVGGGAVGLEMAYLFNSAGSMVTVYEMQNKIAGPFDSEISNLLQKNLEKKGIAFKLGENVQDIADLNAESVLMSVGRRMKINNIGLETLGIHTDNGAIITDDQMRTNVPGVYAAGDCIGGPMLAHTAYREAEVAVNTMLGKKDFMRYDAIPSVIYTNPEAAGCGETLLSAREKGIQATEKRVSMCYSGRYVAENENGNGICKLVVSEERVIGAHMLGNPSSEIIALSSMAIENQMTLRRLQKVIFPHPSVSEIIREAAFS
ncbi:MAG: NAD(P)/FAD-dependent oxidoreductase [Clostridiales bacterium]|nr:NAD(P)/FAD-dependent oxidoreductase [Clostridiales bacterium]